MGVGNFYIMPKKESNKELTNNILPIILVILDGWGITEPNPGNAITLSSTKNLDDYKKNYPFTLLHAHGKYVGLPELQDGNSEAGHMNIGAGRLVEQDAVRIFHSIQDGMFFKNPAFMEAVYNIKNNKSSLHLIGLLSNGMSAHSDPEHLRALLKFIDMHGIEEVYLHLFTDGRDSPKYVALKLAEQLTRDFVNYKCQIRIATIMGRFYGMERTKKWDRTEKAYNAMVMGEGRTAENVESAITQSYNSGESDEFIEPYVITVEQKPVKTISDNDSVIVFNLRSDRARQLAKVFVQKEFDKINPGSFKRKKIIKNLCFVAMTDFGPDLDNILTAYPSYDIKDTLPIQLADLKQLYIAESEKYAHVTYFFNGGYAGAVAGEDKHMVPSPDVKSYDETPAMSSKDLVKQVNENLKNKKYDFTVLNFAAPDMVAHTGNLPASIECCHQVDKCLGEITSQYLAVGGTIVVTADHGNIEELVNLETGEIDTEHSINPVPFIIINKNLKNNIKLRSGGSLCDIAPTILKLMGRKQPETMSGKPLF